jgi:phospholipid transport system substrate-binding protein
MIRTLCATMVLTLAGLGTAHAGPPTEFLESQVRAVRDVLAVPVKAGTPEEAASNDKLKAIINPVMKFEDLSERALRKHWPTLSAPQKARFVALFRELVFHNYLKRVRSANEDYTVAYEEEEAKGRKAASVTAIAKTRKAEIELVFHLTTENGKVWVAEDIVIDEVSLVENYREQFNKIIAKDGFEALLKKMADKLVDLGGEVPAEAAAEATAPATPAPAMKKAP